MEFFTSLPSLRASRSSGSCGASGYSARQHGAIIVLAMIAIVTLLALAALVLGITHRNITRAYLASLADSAALGGASAAAFVGGCQTAPSSADCSSQARWDRVSELVADVVRRSSPPPSLLGSQGLSSFSCTENENSATTCSTTTGELSAVIERGTWRVPANLDPEEPQEPQFVSLEAPLAFQVDFPGYPYLAAFNAVRVSVTARSTGAEFASFFGRQLPATRVAVATVASEAAVPIAPFAIPICSLLRAGANPRESSSISMTDICAADRLLAPTSRYCPDSEPNCRGVVPQFAWDPSFYTVAGGFARTSQDALWFPTDFAGAAGTAMPVAPNGFGPRTGATTSGNEGDQFCFWGSPRYVDPEDNFGFIAGDCGENGEASEDDIIVPLGQTGEYYAKQTPRRLGSKLCPLPDGLQTSRARDALWRMIVGTLPTQPPAPEPTPANPLINENGQYLVSAGNPLRLRNIHKVFEIGSTSPSTIATNINQRCRSIGTAPATPPGQTSSPRPRWPRSWNRDGPLASNATGYEAVAGMEGGTCNSMRTGWGFWGEFPTTHDSPWLQARRPPFAPPSYPASPASLQPNVSMLPFWSTWVAVVADTSPDALPCSQTNLAPNPPQQNRDPRILSKEYEIVGYLKLQVYDLDISDPPPRFPPNNSIFSGGANSFGMSGPRACPSDPWAPCNSAGVPIPYPTVAVNQGENRPVYPWWFNRPDLPRVGNSAPTSCNLVRARLSCEQPPVPAAGGTDGVVPLRLVRDAASQALER